MKTTTATLIPGLICALAIFSGCNGGESASGNLASPAPAFQIDPGVYLFERETNVGGPDLWRYAQDRLVQAGDHVATLSLNWTGQLDLQTMVMRGTEDGDEFVIEGFWASGDRFVGQIRWRDVQDVVTARRVGP